MISPTTPRWLALCAALLSLSACDEQASAPSPDPGGQATSQAASSATTEVAAAAEPSEKPSAAEPSEEPSADGSARAAGSAASKAKPGADGAASAGVAAASAAPAEDEPAGKVKGEAASEGTYSTWLQSAGKYVVGKPASVQAVLVAKGGFKCNDKYPYKFKLNAAPEGVSYPDPVARNINLGKLRSVLTVPFTPTSAGAKTISGTFFFSVCDDTACHIKKAPMSVTVEVSES